MYDWETVEKGIAKYIENEIISKISGWQKWVIGAGANMALKNSTNVYDHYKDNEVIKMIGAIDDNGHINVDEIYNHLMNEAHKNPVTLMLPMIGSITLKDEDVAKLYHYIKE